MKKNLVLALALMFVLSIAGTAFAAANPFVDVPAKHWAYDAVAKLAKAGIVDGYGDGTFRGDKTMTRYEMAQIVAKAMAKSDKADAEQKAMIDKLSVEFAAELNNLGVRVAKLEANASNIKIAGETRLRFSGNSDSDIAHAMGIEGTNAFDWRQRLHLTATVSPNITYTARLEATAVNGSNAGAAVAFNRNFFTIANQFGLDQINVGRFGLYAGHYLAIGKTSNNDGVQIKDKVGDVDVNAFWTTQNGIATTSTGLTDAQTDLKGAFIGQTRKTFDWNLGYVSADKIIASASAPFTAGAPASSAVDFGTWVKLGKGVNLVGEYVSNNATKDGVKDGKAYAVQLSYNWTADYVLKNFFNTDNVVDKTKAHQQGIIASYRSIDTNGLPGRGAYGQFGAVDNETPTDKTFFNNVANAYDRNYTDNVNVWYFGYQNVMQKNVLLNIEWQNFSQKDGDDFKTKQYTAYVQFWF